MIWHQQFTLDFLNSKLNTGLSNHLKMTFTGFTENSLTVTMQVGPEHWQPFGVLHGGASVALAETVGSCAANLVIDSSQFAAVGQEINANHIKAFKQGEIQAIATPAHLGKRSHVWEIRIIDPNQTDSSTNEGNLICISRLTMAIIPKK